MEGSDSATVGQDITHVLAGEGHLVRQLEETTKLHPSLDALNSVRTEVAKRLRLNDTHLEGLDIVIRVRATTIHTISKHWLSCRTLMASISKTMEA